jgi:transcriptional regulator with XRE-family HTH domain
MDVFDIRTENLRLLVHEIVRRRPGRKQKDLATDLGMSPSYLSQLMTGKKMGEDVARKIEAARHLEHGWMDHRQAVPRVAEDRPAYGSQPLRIDPETIAAALQLVRLSFLNLSLEINQEENGTPLALAYDFLIERGERAISVDNLLEFKPRVMALTGTDDGNTGTAGDRTARSLTG